MTPAALLLILALICAPGESHAGSESATSTGGGKAALGTLPDQAAFNNNNFLDPELVEHADSRALAEMIVKRLSNGCDGKRDPARTSPDLANRDIMMLVPDRVLDSVAKYGFKNQHQTASTGGCPCRDQRIQSEMTETQLGLPYTDKTRDLLPKYALMVWNDDKHGDYYLPTGYGNVMVKFKPEVKRRATWTYQNSLGMGNTGRTHYIGDIPEKKCDEFCESQIWGQLDMTDVDSIRIPEGMTPTDSMKALNVPIYTYKLSRQDSFFKDPSAPPGPRTGALDGVTFSDDPVYTPTGVPSPAETLSAQAAKEALGKAYNSAEKSILNNDILGQMTTDELIGKYNSIPASTPPPPDPDPYMNRQSSYKNSPSGSNKKSKNKNGSGSTGGMGMSPSMGSSGSKYGGSGGYISSSSGRFREDDDTSLSNEGNRTLAELAGRKKSAKDIEFLKSVYEKNPSGTRGLIALTGLMGQPWSEFKPLLMKRANSGGSSSTYKYGLAWKYMVAHMKALHPGDSDIESLAQKTSGNSSSSFSNNADGSIYGNCKADKATAEDTN